MSVGGWKHGLSVKIMWVVVKMDNGIIGDFKIGVEMMKWRWWSRRRQKFEVGFMRGIRKRLREKSDINMLRKCEKKFGVNWWSVRNGRNENVFDELKTDKNLFHNGFEKLLCKSYSLY